MLAGSAQAQSVTIEGIEYTVDSDGQTAAVTNAEQNIKTANVLATVNIDGMDYAVTAIGEQAFYDCDALQSVTLPQGLQSIGDDAFYECTSLQSIDIPQGVTGMGPYAFMYCTSLQSVALPDGLQNIGDGAFYGCDALQSVTALGATPPAIEVQTFGKDAYTRTALHVPEGAEEAYRAADYWGWFWNAAHDGITYGIHGNGQSACAFSADEDIAAADIPATVSIDGADYPVAAIGYAAFDGCESLQSVALPEGLQSIGASAFGGCTSLQSVTLPSTVADIANWAFCYCASLESITLPERVQSIGNMAFADCTSLASIVLPSTMQSIDATAFAGCPLKEMHSHAAVPPAVSNGLFDEGIYSEAILHVPSDAVDAYRIAEGWEQFLNILGDLPPTAIGSVAADASLATYANGILTTESPASITVYAQNGAVVRNATDATSLSLAGLPGGIYIICIDMEGQRQVMKVAR